MPVKFAPTTAIPFVRRPLFIILSVFGGIFAIWIIVLCVKTTARIVHRLFKHREEELFDVEVLKFPIFLPFLRVVLTPYSVSRLKAARILPQLKSWGTPWN